LSGKLFIDDLRQPASEGWQVVRSSAEAIEYLSLHGCPELISFDHDLGGDDTAMAVVHWLIERDLDMPGFIPAEFSFSVHSANPIGAQNIHGTLGRYLAFKGEGG
jgi:hypothetical protein